MDMHFDGVIFQTHAEELARRLTRDHPPVVVLDVRPAADYARGHLPGSRSASVSELNQALPDGVDAGTEVVVVGERATDPMLRRAARALQARGVRRVVEFPGGVHEWTVTGRPLASGAATAA